MNNRKKQILCLWVAGLTVMSGALTACGNKAAQDPTGTAHTQQQEQAEASIFAMDTFMKVTAFGPQAEAAVKAAEDEINRLDQLLAAENENGEVGQLNRSGSSTLTADTAYLVERALEINRQTEGAFNMMMYPLMKAWGFIGGEYAVPDQDTIEGLLPLADVAGVTYDPRSREIRFQQQGMEIDFGGIAKGYTSARIMEIFDEYGVTSGIVNLGGNVQVKGGKTDTTPWRVGIQHPEKPGEYLGILSLRDQAAITSGGYERFFEQDGVRYHHILDPETGKPAESGLASVTIISPDGTLADGLSTALFVMGLERAEAFWQEHGADFEAVLVTDDGELYLTEGLQEQFESKLGQPHIIRRTK